MIDNSIEQVLRDNGFIVTEFKGTSMNPLLKSERDKALVKTLSGKLKKRDIALYKRSNGMYVMHRVYKVNKDSYVFWGDNQTVLEYGVKNEDILGVCVGFYKGEKYVEFSKSFWIKAYGLFWCSFVWLRKFLNLFRRAFIKVRRIFSKKN
ncbi:MAG: S24/S26 family peptidase [Clostridia bacterium]|nr:S24/S26 family peptidase [Clostridia bacterium]